MCVKSRNDTIVPTLNNGTILGISLLNAQLPHSSDMKTIGVHTMQMAVLLMPAHIPSSPIGRFDFLNSETMVLPTSQQGQTVMAAGRAKTVVKDSQETAFCVVSLEIGHWSIHLVAGCNHYLHSYLSRMSCSKKTEWGEVCCCM